MAIASAIAHRRSLLAAYHALKGTPGVAENQVNTRFLEQRPDALKRVERELRKVLPQITWRDRLAVSTTHVVVPLPVLDEEEED